MSAFPQFSPHAVAAVRHPDRLPADGQDACDRTLASAIRALLQGADPGTLPLPSPGVYGPWAETMAVLFEAHARGGTPAVKEAHLAVARLNPQLTTLLSADPAPKRTAWTLSELVHTDFLPPEFVVYGLLPVGLSNMAGRPKVGKSILANQIAVAIDAGSEVLGRSVRQSRVFYLALEDSPGRLSARLKKLVGACGLHIPPPPGLTAALEVPIDDHTCGIGCEINSGTIGSSKFATGCRLLGEGGLEQIESILDDGFGVAVIDTFSRACGRADQNDSADMTMIMGALQRMALDHHAAILLVDHHRKSARTSPDTDPIDDIMGSTAKAGVVDCALGLYRRHNEAEGLLKLSGRDFGDAEIPLTWDAESFTWQLREAGGAGDAPGSPLAPGMSFVPGTRGGAHFTERDYATLTAVEELGPATLTQLVSATGEAKGNLYNRLAALCRRGALIRRGYGKGTLYCLPSHASAPSPDPASDPASDPEVIEVMDVMEVMDSLEVIDDLATDEAADD